MPDNPLLQYVEKKQAVQANPLMQYVDAPKSTIPDEKVDEVSAIESALRGGAQGLTFGFADELEALARGKQLEEVRKLYKQAQEQNPLTYGASELGTAVGTAFIPGLGIARGAKLASAAGKAAGLGALAGAGYSEGDLEDRAKAAATSGLVGGAFGAAGHGLSKLMARAAPKAARAATGATGSDLLTKFKPGAGEELLERGIVKFGDTQDDIARKSAQLLKESSDDIGKDLAQMGDISKDSIMANLFTERAKLAGNEANAEAISKLDKVIKKFAKSPKKRSAQDVWNVKKAFDKKVNWKSRLEKPDKVQAVEKVSRALVNSVEGVAAQSDDLAAKFSEHRRLYSLLRPVKEAAEKRVAQQQARPALGLLDTATALGGAGYSAARGDDPLEALIKGAALAGGRRFLAPRTASSTAAILNSPALQSTVRRLPEGFTGRYATPQIWKLMGE